MFLEKKKNEIESKFSERHEKYFIIMDGIDQKLKQLNDELKLILKYIYTSVSIGDIAETDFEVFLDYAVHNVMLWQKYERVQNLPEDLFLEYVVNPSVLDEEIDVCRSAFYYLFLKYMETEDKFWNKEHAEQYENPSAYMEEKTDAQIADEVNFWCAGEAGIEKFTDKRVLSAKNIFTSAGGNKKELAVYVVQALRSVGIPARSICEYSDLTSDNECIEVYISGSWCKKTVCEPWADIEGIDLSDESVRKMMAGRKARAQGHYFVKKKNWKNEEREKFFFGDIFTMNVRAKLLKKMSEKDQIDMKYDVMEEHFTEGYLKECGMDEEMFLDYVLNPRIFDEVIRPWRKMVKNIFSAEQLEEFRKNPAQIGEEIETRFGGIAKEELGKEYVSPAGSMKLGKLSELSKKLLFVAIARTAFIPARFNQENMCAQYWNGEQFCSIL